MTALLAGLALGAASNLYLSSLPSGELIPDAAAPLIAYLLPLSAALIYLALQSMWRHDPARGRDETMDATFGALVGRLVLFVVGLHFLVLIGLTIRSGTGLSRGLLVWLGVLLLGVGNLLPRLRPNHLIGIRSRRLLNDRELWMRVNRIAAYLVVAVGLVLVVAAVVFPVGPAFGRVVGAAVVTAGIVFAVCYWRESRSHRGVPPARAASGS